MSRRPQRRAESATRGHRDIRLAAVLMLLVTLSAAVLVSAGSAHHRSSADPAAHPHGITAAAACGVIGTDHDAPGHEHRHGSGSTPHLTQRLQPAPCTSVVLTVAGHRSAPLTAIIADRAGTGSILSDGDLALLGVLRV